MTTNRRERRIEERRALEARNSKITTRAANKRRAGRPENKTDAQEINRVRARRKFNIPDEPTLTLMDRGRHALQPLFDLMSLLVCSKGEVAYTSILAQMVLCLAAFIATTCWQRYAQKDTHASATSQSIINNTGLAMAIGDLVSFEGYRKNGRSPPALATQIAYGRGA